MAKQKKKTTYFHKNHPLMAKIRDIEKQMSQVCSDLHDETGHFIGWSVARELGAGCTLRTALKIYAD